MSNVIINQTRLHLGLASNSKVDIVSSDSYSFENSRTSAAVPQRSQSVSQLGNFRTKGYSFGCMSDARHDAVLRGFPRRLFHTAVRRTGGLVSVGESAVSALTLNLGHDTPVSWSATLMVDGEETSAAAPAQFEDTQPAYHESQIDYLFGASGFKADLTAAFQGGTLTGNYTVVGTNRRTGPGVLNMAQDVTQSGFSASMTLLDNAETDKLLANEVGFLVIRRRDANFAYCIPMILTALPSASPISGAMTISAGLTQAPGDVVMAAPSSASAATFTVAQGGNTYTIAAGAITVA